MSHYNHKKHDHVNGQRRHTHTHTHYEREKKRFVDSLPRYSSLFHSIIFIQLTSSIIDEFPHWSLVTIGKMAEERPQAVPEQRWRYCWDLSPPSGLTLPCHGRSGRLMLKGKCNPFKMFRSRYEV